MAPGKLPGGVHAPSLPAGGIQDFSPIKYLTDIIGLLADVQGQEVLERVAKIQYKIMPHSNFC